MKEILFKLCLLLFAFNMYSQKKDIQFFNKNGIKISKREFKKSIDYKKTIDLYYETDSIKYGIIAKRANFGKLTHETNQKLRQYLSELTNSKFDSIDNIIINYVYEESVLATKKTPKSTWHLLENEYLNKLQNLNFNIKQFYIASPKNPNLKYYHSPEVSWFVDNELNIERTFFNKPVRSGIFILLKPNGLYYFFLGEYGDFNVLESASKFF